MRQHPLVFGLTLLGGILCAATAWADRKPSTPPVDFHGQYRINTYILRDDDQLLSFASRLRLRPTFDVAVDRDTALHLQLNIGHITANLSQATRAHDGGPSFGARHAVITRAWLPELKTSAGLLPLSDRFGDTLFSGDWDFNPLAVAAEGSSGDLSWRVAAGRLVEGAEDFHAEDNASIAIADLDWGPFGASIYGFTMDAGVGSGAASTLGEVRLGIGGLRYSLEREAFKLQVGALSSLLLTRISDQDIQTLGFAALTRASLALGSRGRVGLLVAFGSGDEGFGQAEDTSSFITPMSLIGAHGYWGYTGKLTIQGPTDTGIDDPINLDGGSYGNANLGRGLFTAQANVDVELAAWVRAYLGVGYFRGAAEGGFQGTDIGVDVYAQLRWLLAPSLTLETGLDVASLGPGYHGAASDERTTLIAGVSRLQLEY